MKRKQWIRGGVILAVLAALVIGFFVNLEVEPADYRTALSQRVDEAKELLGNIETGNGAGQYAKQKVMLFEQAVEQARNDAQDEALEYDQLKPAYEAFGEELASFRTAANKEVLSKEQVQALITARESLERSVSLDEKTQLTWIVSGQTLTKAETLSLEVGYPSAYAERIETLLKALPYETVTLYHEGNLSGRVEISLPYESGHADVQVYRYNPEKNELSAMIRGDVSNGRLLFPVTQGGTYVIYNEDPKETLLSTVLTETNPKEETSSSGDESTSSESVGEEEAQGEESSGDNTGGTAGNSSDSLTGNTESPGESSSDENSGGSSNTSQPDPNSAPDSKRYCTIEIRCDALSSDLSRLLPQHQSVTSYIPADGVMLAKVQMELRENETVLDILKRATRNKGVALEYGSDGYVKGIGQLYEKMAVGESGWHYSVNGWSPNYGANVYKVTEGDAILWYYSCGSN